MIIPGTLLISFQILIAGVGFMVIWVAEMVFGWWENSSTTWGKYTVWYVVHMQCFATHQVDENVDPIPNFICLRLYSFLHKSQKKKKTFLKYFYKYIHSIDTWVGVRMSIQLKLEKICMWWCFLICDVFLKMYFFL